MQHKTPALSTDRLIVAAQTAASEDEREMAMHELWNIHGARLIGIMAKMSYVLDSDFSYRGSSLKERRDYLAGDAYIVFHKVVQDFDLGMGTPFGAYIAQKGNWRVADEKRGNSKHGKREKCYDLNKLPLHGKDPEEEDDLKALRKAMACNGGFDEECLWRDFLHALYQATEKYPKLHRYLGVCLEMLDEGFDYSDAEVARRMKRTRACIGQYKKELVHMVKEDDRFVDIWPRMAA